MSFKILDFYKISSPLAGGETDSEDSSRFKRIRWATFLSATTGYGIYYVCRLSMNV
ncbi:MAG: MFS transporter, partial [Bacteroides xylanisolvens]